MVRTKGQRICIGEWWNGSTVIFVSFLPFLAHSTKPALFHSAGLLSLLVTVAHERIHRISGMSSFNVM